MLLAAIPDSTIPWTAPFKVNVFDDVLAIPGRIYNGEPPETEIETLTPTQQLMLHCLYTRHHDGLVRQRHLAAILGSSEPWVAPYVVTLIGEYVVEILEDIENEFEKFDHLGLWPMQSYARFVNDNRAFFDLVAARVASYYSEYYAFQYARFAAPRDISGRGVYPGFTLLEKLREAVERQRWLGRL